MYNASMKSNIRLTPQTLAVLAVVKEMGHLTNMQILIKLRSQFPNLTATTVHRITNRLIINNLLARGPEIEGVSLIDSNLASHDHFVCTACNGVKDVNISPSVRKELQSQTGISLLPTNLIIYGDCSRCGQSKFA